MARSTQQFADDCASITGFIVPVFETDDLGGEHIAALSPEDARMVLDGYACGNSRCRAIYGGMYRIACPVCGFDRRDQTPDKFMVPVPEMWSTHVAAREAAMADPNPARKQFPSMEQAILGLQHDPDVDNVPLSKLMPSKHGRGRPA